MWEISKWKCKETGGDMEQWLHKDSFAVSNYLVCLIWYIYKWMGVNEFTFDWWKSKIWAYLTEWSYIYLTVEMNVLQRHKVSGVDENTFIATFHLSSLSKSFSTQLHLADICSLCNSA